MPPEANLENVAARLRARRYGSPGTDRLAADVAQGLAAGTKLASSRRGLGGGVVAGQAGGTNLGVGENWAALPSASLQPPQLGTPRANGALAVRMQARVEMERRTLPGVVLASVAGTDSLDLTVALPYATTPRLTTDPVTGQNVASGPAFSGLLDVSAAASGSGVDAATQATAVTVSVPLPDTGETPYPPGKVVDVTTVRQWDVRTHWVNREGRRIPVVTRSLASESHSTPSDAAPPTTPTPGASCSILGINATEGTSGLGATNGDIPVTFHYVPS